MGLGSGSEAQVFFSFQTPFLKCVVIAKESCKIENQEHSQVKEHVFQCQNSAVILFAIHSLMLDESQCVFA